MNRAKLLQSFINGDTKGNASSLKIEGEKLFSYGTCIAERINGTIVVNVTKYSKTTTVQQNSLLRLLPTTTKTVTGLRMGAYRLTDAIQ